MTMLDASAWRVDSSARDIVTRIAEALGVPKAVFFECGETEDPGTLILRDTAELIRLFAQIEDKETRRRYVADVRATSEKLASSVPLDDGNAA